MNESYKLYQVIASLDGKETRQMRKMLRSPFFTHRADVGSLFDVLIKYVLKAKPFPDQTIIFNQVYPELSWDGVRLRGAMSKLFHLIEELLIINNRRADQLKSKLLIAEVYRQRNLEKCYSSTMKKNGQLLADQTKRNADYYSLLLRFQTEQMKFQSSTKRTTNLFLQEIADTNDVLYLTQKLQTICAQLSHQLVHDTEYDYGLLTKLLEQLEQEKYIKIPAVAIYYYCFRFLTEKDNLEYFRKFKQLLSDYRHHFSKQDLEAPYRLAINFCIRKSNEGVVSFVRDSWELYSEGLEEGILLENNYIPRFTFNNIIAAAIRLEEYDWIAAFIEKASPQLEETYRSQTISFNLARLEYSKGNYGKALVYLQTSEYEDLMNNMISKILLMKIYVELEEFESLNSHMDSFEQFIRRRDFSDYHRSNVLNNIRYVRKVVALTDYDSSERKKLRKSIEKEAILSERVWLLQKV